MADLVTPDTIITLLGDDDADEDVIQIYIDLAVGEIEAWLGRPISVQTFEEEYIPDTDGKIFLHHTPVVAVTEVSIDGDVLDEDLYTTTSWGIEDFFYFADFISPVYDFDLDDLEFERYVTVIYQAGLDTPQAINSVIVNAVIRKYRERGVDITKASEGSTGLEEIRVEDYALKYATGDMSSAMYNGTGNSLMMFRSENDFMAIKRYKRRSFA